MKIEESSARARIDDLLDNLWEALKPMPWLDQKSGAGIGVVVWAQSGMNEHVCPITGPVQASLERAFPPSQNQ